MAFLIEGKRCGSPISSAQVNAVIGPTAGMVINRSTRSISNESRSSDRTRALAANGVLHAVAHRLLVYIQSNVIHILHGGASFAVSASARSLTSPFVHQALLL